MSVEDFKFIFWMEYGHRMWGRLMGLGFALPAAAFALRGISRPLAGRLGLLFAMGGAQGLVGWWMVRSGLEVRLGLGWGGWVGGCWSLWFWWASIF